MFRNDYDTDVTTFSPAGRIHQVEYAMEAVKQGGAVVGLRSNDFAVLAAIRRAPADVASFQNKIFQIDRHLGVASSGLIPDARTLSQAFRTEALNYRFVYEADIPVNRLVAEFANRQQVFTQKDEKRPYGVGFLVAGADKAGVHIYETQPSGNYFEYYAQTIGARSQAAKTYLEKHFEEFKEMSLEELIFQGLQALQGTLPSGNLTKKNCQVGYVGKSQQFTILSEDQLAPYIDRLDSSLSGEEEKKEVESSAKSSLNSEDVMKD